MTTPQILLLAFLGVELLALAGLVGWMLGDAHRHRAWTSGIKALADDIGNRTPGTLERDSIENTELEQAA